jgi:hypothetical protein
MAGDAARAMQAAQAAQEAGAAPVPTMTYDELLRELVDERTYPRLYRLAWGSGPTEGAAPPSEREEFLAGVDLILDGVQALIDRAG